MHEQPFARSQPVFRLALPVTEEAAYDAVADYLARRTHGTEVVIHQKPEGELWVYYYESANYLRTHDARQALPGNAPVLVDTTTGEAFMTGTAGPVSDYVAVYRRLRAAKNSVV